MRYIYLLLNILIISNVLFAQKNSGENQNIGIIIGSVKSTMGQKPLSGISVSVINSKYGAITMPDGKFIIRNLPQGTYSVKFSAVGFETFVYTDVNVTGAKPTELNVELTEKIIELKGAEVRASYFIKKAESLTSTQTLNGEEIRRAPGVQEDVIRATALLPGVAVTQAGRNDLVVRGGAPFENLFMVDNIEIPNINHFGSQGASGGPLALINIDYVRNVSFSAGGFGAKYGDKTSSFTNIILRNGNEEKFGGKAVLSATGFGLNIEGPVSDAGSFWLSIRRSYLDFIFKAAGFGFIPEYWDFAGKINLKYGKYDFFNFLTIGALDNVKLNNDNQDNKFTNSQFAASNQNQYFSGITWKHLFDMGFTTVTLGQTYTNFSTFQNDSNLLRIFNNSSKEPETTLKTDFDLQLCKTLGLTFGNQLKYSANTKYNIELPGFLRKDNNGFPVSLNVDTTLHIYKNASYLSVTAGFSQFKITLGGRYDYYGFLQNKLYFSPRLSFDYQINDVSAIIASAGRYYQSPSYVWLIGAPNQNLEPIKVDQAVLGYEHTPMEDLKVQFEVYYKIYTNYPARIFRPQAVLSPSGFDDASSDIPFGLEPLSSSAKGYSTGAELFIQKKLSEIPLYGLLSLSVSETKFKSLDDVERPGAFDTRFILNIALGYRFSSDWEVSCKFRLATGLPSTPYFTSKDSVSNFLIGTKNYSKYNEGARLPLFHQLDMRIDKRWNFHKLNLITYIDLQNLYGRKNISGIIWNQRTQSTEYLASLGILPSIGISLEF